MGDSLPDKTPPPEDEPKDPPFKIRDLRGTPEGEEAKADMEWLRSFDGDTYS